MNEVELIRAQLAAERRHATEVANACATAFATGAPDSSKPGPPAATLDDFRKSCMDYLVSVLTRFEARDQMLGDLLHSRLAPDEAGRRTLDGIIGRAGTSRQALGRLEAAVAGGSPDGTTNAPERRWSEFAQFFNGAWSARRDALDALFERNSRVSDWRTVALVDADSILDERSRYARVHAKLPAGVELRA
jgi:hypothetical protein